MAARACQHGCSDFPPEVILLKNTDKTQEKEFVFVDGGVPMYNNQAFQMFLMATLDRY